MGAPLKIKNNFIVWGSFHLQFLTQMEQQMKLVCSTMEQEELRDHEDQVLTRTYWNGLIREAIKMGAQLFIPSSPSVADFAAYYHELKGGNASTPPQTNIQDELKEVCFTCRVNRAEGGCDLCRAVVTSGKLAKSKFNAWVHARFQGYQYDNDKFKLRQFWRHKMQKLTKTQKRRRRRKQLQKLPTRAT